MKRPAGPLVLLAAGLGSRFGGLKPLAAVGPCGEAIIEYTLWDALAVGFRPVVLVVRAASRDDFERTLQAHGVPMADVALVEQDLDRSVQRRAHPWGTVHATLVGASTSHARCAVVNGDDLYGREPLSRLGQAALAEPDCDHLVAHRWSRTRPVQGRANRGVCDMGPGDRLRAIREVRDLDAHATLDAATPVSMNMWSFRRETLAALTHAFTAFADRHGGDQEELALPDAVGQLLADGLVVRVHITEARWLGVTYAADVQHVRRGIASAVADGDYPQCLAEAWSTVSA